MDFREQAIFSQTVIFRRMIEKNVAQEIEAGYYWKARLNKISKMIANNKYEEAIDYMDREWIEAV